MDSDGNGRKVVHEGKHGKILCAVRENQNSPAMDFLKDIHKKKQEFRKIHSLFDRMVEKGEIRNPSRFKKLEGDIWEFKSGQARILCFQEEGHWILTHGFIKKSQKCPRSEIKKAKEIMGEDVRRVNKN